MIELQSLAPDCICLFQVRPELEEVYINPPESTVAASFVPSAEEVIDFQYLADKSANSVQVSPESIEV